MGGGELFGIGGMTGTAEVQLIGFQQMRLVASMGFVAGETSLLESLMSELPLKPFAVMTFVTEFGRCGLENSASFTDMGIVAANTLTIFDRLMKIVPTKTKTFFIVAFIAQGGTGFDQSQHSDQTVRFMATEAFFFVKRFVFIRSLESIALMAVEAVALF
jgi:hypothetical protein